MRNPNQAWPTAQAVKVTARDNSMFTTVTLRRKRLEGLYYQLQADGSKGGRGREAGRQRRPHTPTQSTRSLTLQHAAQSATASVAAIFRLIWHRVGHSYRFFYIVL